MIRNLAFVAMMVLALAGTAFAQTSPDATGQPGTANAETGTNTPTAQGDPTSPPPADTTGSAQAQPAEAPSDAGAQAPAAPAGQAGLPATASSAPLMFAIGVASIVAFFGLLLYRKSPTARS